MLYPNYDDFVSLSTNHLEVGSHVKDRSKEKKEQFVLPLMRLPGIQAGPCVGLLDLPKKTLPNWSGLPVLNLTGSLTSQEELIRVGLMRRAGLPTCAQRAVPSFGLQDITCIDSDTPQ